MATYDIEAIWTRVKKYVNVNEIRGNTKSQIAESLNKALLEAKQPEKQRGNPKNLANTDFAESATDNRVFLKDIGKENLQNLYDKGIVKEKNQKVVIKTKKKTKTVSQNYFKVSFSKYKGKDSYYFYNTRLKKRTSWGLL